MKSCVNIPLSVALIVMSMLGMTVRAEPGAAPVMRDAASHEQLSKMLLGAEANDPMKNLKPVALAEDPSKKDRPQDLVSQSDMICFGGYATLVPKGAIIQKPKNLESRFIYQKGAKLVTWPAFFAMNRGWISIVEVTRSQAEGKVPFSQETQKILATSTNLMVATYQGGPISVLPLQPPTNGKPQ